MSRRGAIAAALVAALVAVLVVVGGVALWSLWADDERSVQGTCDVATYELTLDEDSQDTQLEFSLDASADDSWEVTVQQDDEIVLETTQQADQDGEIEVDVPVTLDGDSAFVVTAKRGGNDVCIARLSS